MNRSTYYNGVEEKLCILATRLEVRGNLNILDLHIHSENFYANFFNLLFGWNLCNLNFEKQNSAGIDLVDKTNNIVVQVSAVATKQKVESALSKDLASYSGYSFKFISISRDASDLRSKKFKNPHNLVFVPSNDIHDVKSILDFFVGKDIAFQEKVHDFVCKELRHEPEKEKIESNITAIIRILAQEDWGVAETHYEVMPFEIDAKILFNGLKSSRDIIEEHKIHGNRIDKIYDEYDKQGKNKSQSIFNSLRMEYIKLSEKLSPDDCFCAITDSIIEKICMSANYVSMPAEELFLCVQILVVDAFVRCKIFKNPSGVPDACP